MPDPGGFVEPDYGHRSLADVVPAVAHALGSPVAPAPAALELPPAAAYVVLLVDGLGADLLARHASAAPYLSSLLRWSEPGTCGVPSTTAASLTSLGTGLAPGGHGLVGFTSAVPGTDLLHNNLWWDQGLDPAEWQPHPTTFTSLAAAGVAVTVVNRREFATSGLTAVSSTGGRFVGADSAEERTAAAVAASAARPSLTYLYDSDLDHAGHRWGVASPQWTRRLSAIDAETEQLRAELPVDRRLVVVADHGMVDATSASRFDLDDHAALGHGVRLLGGEARFRHVYCRDGARDDVAATWREVIGDRAEVLTREEAVRRGWFGAVEARVSPRIGDVVAACRDDHVLLSSRSFGYETSLVGFHGSLTSAEMRIPILVD